MIDSDWTPPLWWWIFSFAVAAVWTWWAHRQKS